MADDIGFLPGAPELRIGVTGDPTDPPFPIDESFIVNEYYQKAARSLRASGHEIEITTSEFRTIYPADFDSIQIDRLATLFPESQLAVDLEYLHPSGTTQTFVHLDAYWRNGTWAVDELDISLGESLTAFESMPGHAGSKVRAVTAFRVQGTVLGQDVDYRPLVLWILNAESRTRLVLQDHALGINHLLTIWNEDVTITPIRELEALNALFDSETPAASPGTEWSHSGRSSHVEKAHVCVPQIKDVGGPGQVVTGILGHPASATPHSARIRVKHRVWCRSTCRAECTASFAAKSCTEPGPPFVGSTVTKHVISAASTKKSKNSNTGECGSGAALQCMFGECIAGHCPGMEAGVSIGFSGFSAGANFANSSEALESINMESSWHHYCGREPHVGGGCYSLDNFRTTMHLGRTQPTPAHSTPSNFRLEGLVPGGAEKDGTRIDYLIAEWALLESCETPRILSTSLDAYAHEVAHTSGHGSHQEESSPSLATEPDLVLVFDGPVHPPNHRAIPVPEVALGAHKLDFEMADTRLVVRVLLGADPEVRTISIIHSFDGLVMDDLPHEIMDFLSTHLQPKFVNQHRHAVEAFLEMEVRRDTIRIVQGKSHLPRCCCDFTWCA